MSILIKGMKMPKNCVSCWLSRMRGSSLGGILDCKILGTVGAAMDDPHDILNKRHPDCPLIELPEKHGRLVDADIAYDKIAEQEGGYYMDMDGVGCGLGETPTVFEAEGEDG